MGLPSSWMVPETRCAFPLALMRFASTLRSDVLPAPLGPMIAQVLPPPSEPEMPLRISFSLALVPTPYLTSAQEKVESIVGATWTRCTSVACCFSVISRVALDIWSADQCKCANFGGIPGQGLKPGGVTIRHQRYKAGDAHPCSCLPGK